MESQLLFDNLFKRAYPKLFFYARSIVGNEDDAEDVVEDVFLELWRRRDSVEWGDKIDAYLYRAVFTRS
ncbi:MAG: sigma factor, partial [Prevotella sp.]|nr:sigma factor [Prevotella sp.]